MGKIVCKLKKKKSLFLVLCGGGLKEKEEKYKKRPQEPRSEMGLKQNS